MYLFYIKIISMFFPDNKKITGCFVSDDKNQYHIETMQI